MQESRTGSMISKQWIKETRKYFLDFLRATHFPELSRQSERGPAVEYPEWLIMLIGIVAVKTKEKTYVGIHRLSTRYWHELCGKEVTAAPISESRLRLRLKKIRFAPGTGAGYIQQIFPPDYLRQGGERRQEDGARAGASLASQAASPRDHPQRTPRLGH
jgi:hypothetical protein